MDRDRYSHVAHRGLTLCNPLAASTLRGAFAAAAPPAGARVLDIGAGKAGVAALLLAEHDVVIDAIEHSPYFVDEAQHLNADAINDGRLRIHCGEADSLLATQLPGPYDLALCIGASQALGGYRATLARLPSLLTPAGVAIIAEGYWRRPPPAAYLAFLGASADDLSSDDDNVAVAQTLGWHLLARTTASDEEWRRYEDSYHRNALAFLREYPLDADAAVIRERSTAWRAMYLQHGHSTLGFGLYVLSRGERRRTG